jgi:hypothetical protein
MILNDVLQMQPMIGVSSDAIRAGVRYLQTHKRINEEPDMVEDQLPWEMLIGLIQRYDHQNIPLIVEGVVFTPERVNSLKLKNLELRAAFVGFSSDVFVEQTIEYGKQSKDWVYEKIVANGGSEESVREMFAGLQQKGVELREKVDKYGYQYFTPDNKSFTDYKIEVVSFLLQEF